MSISNGPKINVIVNAANGDIWGDPTRQLFRMLQVLVQANVKNLTLSTPPTNPSNGDSYVVATGATGAWTGFATQIAYWTTDNPAFPLGTWEFWQPQEGWQVYDYHTAEFYVFSGSAWVSESAGGTIDASAVTYHNPSYPTVQAALDKLLYVTPIFTSFTNSVNTVELGSSVPNVLLNWAYNKPMVTQSFTAFGGTAVGSATIATITNIAINGSNLLTVTCANTFAAAQQITLSGLTTARFLNGQTVTIVTPGLTQFTANFTHAAYPSAPDTGSAEPVSQTYTGPFTSNQTWTINASDGTTPVSDSSSIAFDLRRYWGVNSATSLTNSQILALSSEFAGNAVSGSFVKSIIYNCSPGPTYPYYAYPVAWGGPPSNVTVGGLPFSDFSVATQSVTNASGHVDSYYVIRFNNIQTGSNISVVWQ